MKYWWWQQDLYTHTYTDTHVSLRRLWEITHFRRNHHIGGDEFCGIPGLDVDLLLPGEILHPLIREPPVPLVQILQRADDGDGARRLQDGIDHKALPILPRRNLQLHLRHHERGLQGLLLGVGGLRALAGLLLVRGIAARKSHIRR